jgi:hypothetical protein
MTGWQDDRMTGWQTGWQTEDPRWIYDRLVGFGRACAPVRCAHPSFWAHCLAKQGAARPPPIAASLVFLRFTRAACVKGLFLSTLLPRPESTQSARPSIQSSALGPPTPSTAKECGSPLWIQGGNTLTSGWGGGGDQFRRWGIHSGTPAPHIAASLIFPANIK